MVWINSVGFCLEKQTGWKCLFQDRHLPTQYSEGTHWELSFLVSLQNSFCIKTLEKEDSQRTEASKLVTLQQRAAVALSGSKIHIQNPNETIKKASPAKAIICAWWDLWLGRLVGLLAKRLFSKSFFLTEHCVSSVKENITLMKKGLFHTFYQHQQLKCSSSLVKRG